MYLVQVLSCCDNVTALGTNSSGQLAFQDPSQPYNPNTFWYVDQGFSPKGQPLGFVLRHVNTGNTLAAKSDGTIVFKQINALDGWSTWTAGNVNQAFGMRPFADSGLNFNILGGCGKSKLGLWQWGGGQNNEIWRLIFPSGTSAPKNNYKISSGCADFKGNHPPLALGDGGSVVCGTLDTKAATWNIEMQFAAGGRAADERLDRQLQEQPRAAVQRQGESRRFRPVRCQQHVVDVRRRRSVRGGAAGGG